MIHNGHGDEVARKNLRREGNIGSSSHGLNGVDWDAWKNRFHLRQVTILGHSFGGATAVEVLRHVDQFQWVGQGIIYDIWGAAIQPPEENINYRINKPLLVINSEAFMYVSNTLMLKRPLSRRLSSNVSLHPRTSCSARCLHANTMRHLAMADIEISSGPIISNRCLSCAVK